jgi:hypothetical protein
VAFSFERELQGAAEVEVGRDDENAVHGNKKSWPPSAT